MFVPPLKKDYEKLKLLDLMDNCGLSKVEIAEKTRLIDEGGFGTIGVQTIYDMYGKKHEPKLYQVKEILRVINEHNKTKVTLAEFVNEEISRTPIVLSWNYEKNILEQPKFTDTAKTVYFPSVINQPKTLRAILFDPIGHTSRTDAHLALFNTDSVIECCEEQEKLETLLHRNVLIEDHDGHFFYGTLIKIINKKLLLQIFDGVKEEHSRKHMVNYYSMKSSLKEIAYKNIYCIAISDLSILMADVIVD